MTENTEDLTPVLDFSQEVRSADWRSVTDDVMGGLSRCRLVLETGGVGRFEGNLSLENEGGFASVRTSPRVFHLGGCSGLVLRVCGDGRTYQFRVRTDELLDGISYRAPFRTVAEEWKTLRVAFEEFTPTFRGQEIPDAPRLDPSRIRQVGFMIADRREGPFTLWIAWVKAYRDPKQG